MPVSMQRREMMNAGSGGVSLASAGFAVVERSMCMGGIERRRGDVLTRAELTKIPKANLTAMLENRLISLQLELFPAAAIPTPKTTKGVGHARPRN